MKAAIDLPLGIWLMKGFYDTVPWEIEMAGVVDGASRFTRLAQPRAAAGAVRRSWRSALFSFLSGWGEFILPQVLAPGSQVQVLSVYLAGLIADDNNFDFGTFKAVGVFYVIPVLIALRILPQISHEHLWRRDQGLMRILLDNFSKSFGSTKVIENMNLEVGAWRDAGAARPFGLRQVDDAVCRLRHPSPDRRPHPLRRPGRRPTCRARSAMSASSSSPMRSIRI